MRLLITILLIASGIVLGGLVGHSQVLCADGTCVITGSWYGGAIAGGLLGMVLATACPACMVGRCALPSADASLTSDTPDAPDALRDR